jgi:hypothetical protein
MEAKCEMEKTAAILKDGSKRVLPSLAVLW